MLLTRLMILIFNVNYILGFQIKKIEYCENLFNICKFLILFSFFFLLFNIRITLIYFLFIFHNFYLTFY